MRRRRFFFLLICIMTTGVLHAQSVVRPQQPAGDTSQVQILKADRLKWKKINDNTELQILAGNVNLLQGTTLFYCDSCVLNQGGHMFEAFGNVRIIDKDTSRTRSDYLRYMTDSKIAYLTGNVKLTDGHATLTTNNLEYDVANKIGTYRNGGRVVNQKSVLTSEEGVYYTDLKDIYFKRKVELKDPAYYLKSDSLLYNTESQTARFIAETYIRDSSKRVVRTSDGIYDLANKKAEFYARTYIEDGAMTATANQMASDDKKGIILLESQAVVRDTSKGYVVIGDKIWVDKKTDATLATKKPLMIIKQDQDSIYVTADTLFSARLTELYKNDSIMLKKLNLKEKDSTNRYFEAFRNVKVFTDSVQSVSDSLFYSFKDSTFRLYYDPIVWNKKNQLTGDTIYLFTKNKKADRVKVFENSFMISELDPGVYNQVKSTRIDGYFKEGAIDSVRARGFAESVYFIQDNDSAYSSVNQTKSDLIDVYFQKGEIQKVVFRTELKGTLYPLSQKHPSDMKLDRFEWLIERRPKTKYDLFQ